MIQAVEFWTSLSLYRGSCKIKNIYIYLQVFSHETQPLQFQHQAAKTSCIYVSQHYHVSHSEASSMSQTNYWSSCNLLCKRLNWLLQSLWIPSCPGLLNMWFTNISSVGKPPECKPNSNNVHQKNKKTVYLITITSSWWRWDQHQQSN